MKFPRNNVRLTARKDITSKAGNDLTFVTLVDKATFEFIELKLALTEGQNMTDIVEQRDYNAVIEYDGNYGSVTLTPVKV